MARSRNIKPSFFTNDKLAECDFAARLLFIGLWTIADREGRLCDRPKKIKAEILPYDNCDADALLQQLNDCGLIKRYKKGDSFIQVVNFTKHQQPHYKEMASCIPAPDDWVDSGKTAGGVQESLRLKIIERDGKCMSCGSKDDLTLDHITPRSLGGSHEESNLQTLCRKCNSSKNNRLLSQSQHQPNIEPTLAQPSRSMTPLNPLTDSLLLIPDSPIPIVKCETEVSLQSLAEDAWAIYPSINRSKGSKKDFISAYKVALKKTTHEIIMEGIKKYDSYCRNTGQSTQDAFRWIQKERWADDYSFKPVTQQRAVDPASNAHAKAQSIIARRTAAWQNAGGQESTYDAT